VEIMADHGVDGLTAFLRGRENYYDAVLVSRPHNMNLVRRAAAFVPGFFDRSTFIYDAEAIFSFREGLQLELAGTPLPPAELQEKIKEEIRLSETAHAIVTVSASEAATFRQYSKSNVHVLGHSLTVRPTEEDFDDRSDILFVGAIDDDLSPNVDSLVWFVNKIMPRLNKSWRLNIIGRNKSKVVRSLASERVRLYGMIRETRQYYSKARIFIAPTRFAAGIPIKVLEAAAAGVPCVATTLLARQLGWTHGNELLCGDTPEEFAEACTALYTNGELWRRVQANSVERVSKDCDLQNFGNVVKNLLNSAHPAKG
jgi:glycosyltransferase involved in cell wall biosynthesis